jgi:hypothetical protein
MNTRLLCISLVPFCTALQAEEAPPYFTVSPWQKGVDSWAGQPAIRPLTADERAALPSRVDNSERAEFPPIREQGRDNCCSQAGASTTFSYEWCVMKGLSASNPKNRFPAQFAWNFVNGGENSGSEAYQGWETFRTIGVPTEATYGGWRSPSPASWPADFSVWLDALRHRVAAWTFTRIHDADSLAEAKGWLFNHNRKGDAKGGVFVVDGFCINLKAKPIPVGAYEAGKIIWPSWPKPKGNGGHIMTLVGYDDAVVFDRNGDGKITTDIDINGDGKVDLADSERGAFIVVNSWGENFANRGKIYVPYGAVADPAWFRAPWLGRVVPKEYAPRLVAKVKVFAFDRAKLRLSAGIATSADALKPEREIAPPQFNGKGEPGGLPILGPGSADAATLALDLTPLLKDGGERPFAGSVFITASAEASAHGGGRIDSVSVVELDAKGAVIREIPVTSTSASFGSVPVPLHPCADESTRCFMPDEFSENGPHPPDGRTTDAQSARRARGTSGVVRASGAGGCASSG